jgi:prepilin-type N-terminal cleavage/methylation domain-containing protein
MQAAYRTPERTSLRKAFSLVELLVVIGIIALLVALMLPAVNSVIESSRRNGCQAIQSRMALGMARHNARKEILPGIRNDITTAGTSSAAFQGNVNWFIASLPYLDRPDVYDAIVAGKVFAVRSTDYGFSPGFSQGLDALYDLTRCPSSPLSKGDNRAFFMQYLANGGTTTFGVSSPPVPNENFPFTNTSGPPILTSINRNDGALGDNATHDPRTLNNPSSPPQRNPLYNPMSVDDIRQGDGQSNTLLTSETIYPGINEGFFWSRVWTPLIVDIRGLTGGVVQSSDPGAFQGVGGLWRRVPANVDDAGYGLLFGFASMTVTATTPVINAGQTGIDYPSMPGLHTLPKSRHEGGCFVSFVDGSTRFLKMDLPPHVYGHLLTSRSVYNAAGPTGQKYTTNSVLANRYLDAPSYTGPQPYVLQSTDY